MNLINRSRVQTALTYIGKNVSFVSLLPFAANDLIIPREAGSAEGDSDRNRGHQSVCRLHASLLPKHNPLHHHREIMCTTDRKESVVP